jgi:hypothetical protein
MHMLSTRHVVCIVAILFALSFTSFGQLPTGTPVFCSFDSDGVNTINLGSLNIHTQIPIFSKPGKGVPFSAILNHDNVAWYPSGGRWLYATNGTTTGLDWIGQTPVSTAGPAGYAYAPALCSSGQGTRVYTNWSYVDVFNTTHGTLFQLDSAGCLYGTTGSGTSADGYALAASVSQGAITGVGPNVPTNMTASGAGTPWAQPGNIKFDDAAVATVSLWAQTGGDPSNELIAKGFGFTVPSNAVITGIKVEIDRFTWNGQSTCMTRTLLC